MSWLDFQIGRVLGELDALALAAETVVVLHGDHGWQLGEHNSWHKYTTWELGVRVPLVVRSPDHPAAAGRVASGLAELVDLYPTVAELAGTPPPSDRLDGVALTPFLDDPGRSAFPTPGRGGVRNKTLAFSQYPHGDDGALVPGTACPWFRDGGCHPAPREGLGGGGGNGSRALRMGFGVRSSAFRYVVWLPYNGTRAAWPAEHRAGLVEELYDHRGQAAVTAMDGLDDVENVAYDAAHAATAAAMFGWARQMYHVLVPPTAPAGGAPGCGHWCLKNWSRNCAFVGCKDCPECRL